MIALQNYIKFKLLCKRFEIRTLLLIELNRLI